MTLKTLLTFKTCYSGGRAGFDVTTIAPGSGRPESTKNIGCALQLLGSKWNRIVLVVLGSCIHACLLIELGASSDVLALAVLNQFCGRCNICLLQPAVVGRVMHS